MAEAVCVRPRVTEDGTNGNGTTGADGANRDKPTNETLDRELWIVHSSGGRGQVHLQITRPRWPMEQSCVLLTTHNKCQERSTVAAVYVCVMLDN